MTGAETISSSGGAGAIKIDAGDAVEFLVQRLARILFQMRALDAHLDHAAIV